MNALILVDIQNDFVPGGALAVANGNDVVAVANERIPQFDLVVATQDWHPANHLSFASQHDGLQPGNTFELAGKTQVAWPDHCVQGTFGAEFVSDLNINGIHHVIRKGTDRNIDSYSGFFDNAQDRPTGLGDLLVKKNVNGVFVMGLATDYCVKFTALDSARLGFETQLILNGCRGVELHDGDIDEAIAQMRDAGIRIG